MKLGNWHGNVDIMKSMATVKHTQVVLQWNKVGILGTTLVVIYILVLNINILHGYYTKSHGKHILKKSHTRNNTWVVPASNINFKTRKLLDHRSMPTEQ